MTREEVLEFLERRRKAWEARDSRALALTHTEDGTVVSPMFATVHGREAIQHTYDVLFRSFPDWDYVTDEPLIDGDRVAQPFTGRATHNGEFFGLKGTGKRFEIQGVMVLEMRDGLVAVDRRVYDFTGLLFQLGVLKGKFGH